MHSLMEVIDNIHYYLTDAKKDDRKDRLLASLKSLTPNQRYSYLLQIPYIDITSEPKKSKDLREIPCLPVAIYWRQFDLIKCILDLPTPEQRYDLLALRDVQGDNAIASMLRWWYRRDSLKIFKHLLDSVTPDLLFELLKVKPNDDAVIPIHFSETEVIRLICDRLSDYQLFQLLFIENSNAFTALTLAILNHNLELVRLFISAITSQTLRSELLLRGNCFDYTPLHYAATYPHEVSLEITETIINSVLPNTQVKLLKAQDEEGSTAADHARLLNLNTLLTYLDKSLEKALRATQVL